MAARGEAILEVVRAAFPPRFALEGDRTGLQVGRVDREIERVLCTLDLTLAVAEEARDRGAQLVLSHHAVIYRRLEDLRTDQVRGRILETLLKHDVAVYVPHTALDVVPGGLNDHLAELVGLRDPRFLEATGSDGARLLVAPAPPDAEAFGSLLCAQGAQRAWRSGDRLEVLADERTVTFLARRVEERCGVPPTVFPLASHERRRGIGRIGTLERPESLQGLARRLKHRTGAPGVRVVSTEPDVVVSKVAVLGGDGRSFVPAAAAAGADALVTGDIDHHTALDARARGLNVIDLGHWASERQAAALLARGLRERLADLGVEVFESEVDTNPFEWL
ncbi:MAG: Nif3-like dinuclear metal center hexameric protein [Planctomycetota bacterium]|nr:MAG: Nif3-like dinuclear metal center hexameric protein [Planctomycetota bacterium]